MSTNLLAMVVGIVWIIEGGARTSKPYGISSVAVHSRAEAKRVCENTVRNNWRRWQERGSPGCFFQFLARRYVGWEYDPRGAVHWERNMRRRLGHYPCSCHEKSDPMGYRVAAVPR